MQTAVNGVFGSYKRFGYLWTWTCPDVEGQSSAVEILKRWKKHAGWLQDNGLRCVRSLERGSRTGKYHIHAITDQWWDIDRVRAHAEKCGFGRLNVRVVPREKLLYIAKYISKPGRFPIPKGVRLWGCVGFRGTRMRDIRCHITELTPVIPNVRPSVVSVVRWYAAGELIRERIVRPDWSGDPAEVHTMNITKENLAQIAGLVSKGAMVLVAEYRTFKPRRIEFDEEDKNGVKTGKRVVRKLVEHGVERELAGGGVEQMKVTTWLPDDADLGAVKEAAARGEPVLVVIEQFTRRFGITASAIHGLANFNGKLS